MKSENKIVLAFEKEDRLYRFELPNNAPLGEAHEAAMAFLIQMVELIKTHADKMSSEAETEKEEDKAEDAVLIE